MKKLSLIIPIVSLAAVATSVGATVSCNSDKVDKVIDLTTQDLIGTEAGLAKVIYSEAQTLEQGRYIAAIDMDGFWETDHRVLKYESYFVIRTYVGESTLEPEYAKFDNAQIWYDNTKLEKVNSYSDLGPNKYFLEIFEKSTMLRVGKGTIKTGKEKVKIKFNLLESIENYYLCFIGPKIE